MRVLLDFVLLTSWYLCVNLNIQMQVPEVAHKTYFTVHKSGFTHTSTQSCQQTVWHEVKRVAREWYVFHVLFPVENIKHCPAIQLDPQGIKSIWLEACILHVQEHILTSFSLSQTLFEWSKECKSSCFLYPDMSCS